MKCLEVNFRQCTYCLQNLGITCSAYSFSPLHEMPDIFQHFMKCLTSRIAFNIHTQNKNQKQKTTTPNSNPTHSFLAATLRTNIQYNIIHMVIKITLEPLLLLPVPTTITKNQLLAFFTLFGFFRERSFRVNPIIQPHLVQKHTAPTFSADKGERKE